MDIIRRCPYCQKVYFVIEGEPCPFCGKKEKEYDIFREMFGDDNPFSTLKGL